MPIFRIARNVARLRCLSKNERFCSLLSSLGSVFFSVVWTCLSLLWSKSFTAETFGFSEAISSVKKSRRTAVRTLSSKLFVQSEEEVRFALVYFQKPITHLHWWGNIRFSAHIWLSTLLTTIYSPCIDFIHKAYELFIYLYKGLKNQISVTTKKLLFLSVTQFTIKYNGRSTWERAS